MHAGIQWQRLKAQRNTIAPDSDVSDIEMERSSNCWDQAADQIPTTQEMIFCSEAELSAVLKSKLAAKQYGILT